MANTVSSKKRVRQNIKRRQINVARKSSIKTAVKNVLDALEQKKDRESVIALLKEAEIQLQRANNKGLLHSNTVARKISRLAKKVAVMPKASA